jgi:serine/threonine protein kinase
MQTACGSPAYVAPEIIRWQAYTAAADIWSAGVLLFLMVTGHYPFNPENMSVLMQEILTQAPALPPDLSPPLANLILGMLDKDPASRIQLQEIRRSPWIAGTEDGELLARDGLIINKLRTMDIFALDEAIAGEMKALGFDLTGIMAELTGAVVSQRTAAYRILMRRRAPDDILEWQNMASLQTGPTGAGKAGLHFLVLKAVSLPQQAEPKRTSEIFGSARGMVFAPKFRKRATLPKLSLTPVPVGPPPPNMIDAPATGSRNRRSLVPL